MQLSRMLRVLILFCAATLCVNCGGGGRGTSASDVVPSTPSTPSSPSSTGVGISVTPTAMAIQTRASLQFNSTVSGSTNTSVTWSVNGTQGGNSTVGTISTGGLYVAPGTAPSGGSVTVTATSAASTTASASATVNISATPSVAVSVSPTSASVTAGKTQQFTGTVTGTTSTGVTWQVNNVTGGNSTVGTISTSGLYTAPTSVPSGGSVTVTAIDSTASASATVSITAVSSGSGSSTGNYWTYTPTKYAAMSGGSGSACTSSAPCTIAYAFANAQAGDVWQVAPGTDALGSGYATISASGTSSRPVVFTCANPASWAWENGATNSCYFTSTNTGNHTLAEITGSYVVLDGFNISNLDTAGGLNLGVYVSGGHDTVSRSVIHDFTPSCSGDGGGAVDVANGSAGFNVLDANVIYNWGVGDSSCTGTIQYGGFQCEEAGSAGGSTSLGNCTITNNIMYNWHGGPAIEMGTSGGSGNAVAANNLIFSVGNTGILYGDGTLGVFPNNIIVNNGGDTGAQSENGVAYYGCCSGSLAATVTNNVLYGNTSGNFAYGGVSGTFTDTGILATNPATAMFVNWQSNGSGNYHSASGSVLVGAGTCTGAPNHDFDGNTRSGSCDIGPYQH